MVHYQVLSVHDNRLWKAKILRPKLTKSESQGFGTQNIAFCSGPVQIIEFYASCNNVEYRGRNRKEHSGTSWDIMRTHKDFQNIYDFPILLFFTILQILGVINIRQQKLWCFGKNIDQDTTFCQHFLWDMNKTKWCNGFYIEFRQHFAKETFS